MKGWTKEAQSLWECVNSALVGLKRCGFINADEYDDIINRLQKALSV